MFLKRAASSIPSNFTLCKKGLERCRSAFQTSGKLCGSELLFLYRFWPLHQRGKGSYEMLIKDSDESILRTPSEDDQLFWRELMYSAEYKKLIKIIHKKIL